MHRTLLRGAAQDRRERRRSSPDIFQARILFMPPFEARDTVCKIGLILVHAKHFVLHPPEVVARLESSALRIHSHALASPSQCLYRVLQPPSTAGARSRTHNGGVRLPRSTQ